MSLTAAAKVNLALEVLGKRADGYHELATVMQTIDLADRLVLEDADELALTTTSAQVPADGGNLALRAVAALREAAKVDRGVRIVLDKRIPVAAGLGGGSSDAAAVLLGLNRLWNLRWSFARLGEVAETLGMDVPFFLKGGVALGTGRGERLTAMTGMPLALVLVNPGTPLSTAAVYGRMTPPMYSSGARARTMADALRTRKPARVAASLYNGLEAAAAGMSPESDADARGSDRRGRSRRSDVGQRADGVRNRALVRAGAPDPGAPVESVVGMLGGTQRERSGRTDTGGIVV